MLQQRHAAPGHAAPGHAAILHQLLLLSPRQALEHTHKTYLQLLLISAQLLCPVQGVVGVEDAPIF